MVVQSAPASAPAEKRIVLHNISWKTYELILADQADSRSPRFAYDRGELEVMSPLREHERANLKLANLVQAAADALDLDYDSVGSTTFKRVDLDRGFEADSAFYFGHMATGPDDEHIDLRQNPPPDLVVEIEISRSSLGKLDLYAAFRVPEVWRWRGNGLTIHVLTGDQYVERESSTVLPGVRASEVSALVGNGEQSLRIWLRGVLAWANGLRGDPDAS
jgi:Uma2 family endonuclease